MELQKALQWRYAVKKYSNRKVSDADLQAILDATNLSASSAGMQPYRVFVLKNEAIRKQLRNASFNAQIEEASHLLVFAAFDDTKEIRINEYISFVAGKRGMPVEGLNDFKKSLESHLLPRTAEENFVWASRQAYIALGTALAAAAELKVDSTPMEGFDRELMDNLLGLKELGLKSVVILALGYRDEENDVFAKFQKVRLPIEKFMTIV